MFCTPSGLQAPFQQESTSLSKEEHSCLSTHSRFRVFVPKSPQEELQDDHGNQFAQTETKCLKTLCNTVKLISIC